MKKESFSILFLLFFVFFTACSSEKNEVPQKVDNDKSENQDSDQTDANEPSDNEPDAPNPDFEDLECGVAFGDFACDFTLPLESGDWHFAKNYSKDENYLFVFYRGMNQTSGTLWNSNLFKLFDLSPENIHYFFIVETESSDFATKKAQIIKDSVKDAFDTVDNDDIINKIHIVTVPASETDPWINKWLEANKSEFFFGIDRFRRIRSGGFFSEFDNLFKEAEFYDYEKKSADLIKENATFFKGLDKVPFAEEGWVKDIPFDVEFKNLSENGELYIRLEQICDTPKKCEWDRLERLFLCDETGENCETEIGRWITTYGRSGNWLTDITPLKPFFEKDGKYRFKLTVEGDFYVNSLDFVFVKKEAGQPRKVIPLFNQREQFDENYNSHFEPKILNEENVKKAEIVAFITGHGNVSEKANCAEFCKFESVFTVNGNDFEIDFSNAGTPEGCFEEVKNGVVPNQYGSWPFGRAGWCPGQNVSLIKIDVTKALVSGENTFSYGGYLDGEIYVPVVTDENGYRAEIYLSSYLVIY